MAEAPEGLSLQKNMAWNSVGSLVYLGCSWLTTVLVVTLSSNYSDSGALAVAMSVGNLTSAIVAFKVRPIQVSLPESGGTSGDFVGLRVVTSLVALLFTVAYCLLSVSPENYLVVALYALFKVVESFVDVYHGIFQKHNRLDFAGKSQIVRGVLLLVSFVLGLVAFDNLAVSICLMTVTTALSIALYDLPRAKLYGSIYPRFDSRVINRLAKTCVAGFVSSLLITMVVSIARQAYGLGYGNEELGHYAAVATPCVIVQALASYVYAPLYGTIGEAHARHDDGGIKRLVVRVLFVIACLLIVCLALAVLLGRPALVLVYGQSISSYSYLLYGALFCTAGFAALSFLLDVLIILGRSRLVALFSVIPIVICAVGTHCLCQDSNSISLLVVAAYLASIIPLLVVFFGAAPEKG